jgi:hypothetical protein
MKWHKLALIFLVGFSTLPSFSQVLTDEEKEFLFAQIQGVNSAEATSSQDKRHIPREEPNQQIQPQNYRSANTTLDDAEVEFFRDLFNQDAEDFRFLSYQKEKKSVSCFTQVFLLRGLIPR